MFTYLGGAMDRTLRQCAISSIFAFTAGCSSGDFAAGGGQNLVDKPVKCVPTKTKSCAPKGPGDPTNPPVDPNIPDKPVQPVLQIDNGGIAVNVKVTKIHVKVDVDHVTDFIVTATEMYAVHHELGIPKFALVELYGADGKVIDTQNWTMSFPNCNVVKGIDANCQSTKIQLKAGSSFKGTFTKMQGRGDAKIIAAPANVRVTDCGSDDCGAYGATGKKWSGASTYEWTVE
jgi:hypothetical protein